MIEKRRGLLVFIGSGTAAEARTFSSLLARGAAVFTDPMRRTYRELDMHRGLLGFLHFRALKHAMRAWQAGFRQAGVHGDPWQLGGCAVVDREGQVVHVHRETVLGELHDQGAALKAFETAAQ